VNTINREVLSEFKEIAGKIQNDPSIKAVVISSAKPDNFIAGADIAYVYLLYRIVLNFVVSDFKLGIYISLYWCQQLTSGQINLT